MLLPPVATQSPYYTAETRRAQSKSVLNIKELGTRIVVTAIEVSRITGGKPVILCL
jgi:hypothetical protein